MQVRDGVRLVECLISIHEALGLSPNTIKRGRGRRRKWVDGGKEEGRGTGKTMSAHLKGYQGFIRIHSGVHNKVNSQHGLSFCSGVNGTSCPISDHHRRE